MAATDKPASTTDKPASAKGSQAATSNDSTSGDNHPSPAKESLTDAAIARGQEDGDKPTNAQPKPPANAPRQMPDAPVQLADEITVGGVEYDDNGHLVSSESGRKVALAADATDPDVGWTVQHGHGPEGFTRNQQPSEPDQTFHPDELPDPVAALRAGLLPQDVGGLNVDEDKFEKSKPLLV